MMTRILGLFCAAKATVLDSSASSTRPKAPANPLQKSILLMFFSFMVASEGQRFSPGAQSVSDCTKERSRLANRPRATRDRPSTTLIRVLLSSSALGLSCHNTTTGRLTSPKKKGPCAGKDAGSGHRAFAPGARRGRRDTGVPRLQRGCSWRRYSLGATPAQRRKARLKLA